MATVDTQDTLNREKTVDYEVKTADKLGKEHDY